LASLTATDAGGSRQLSPWVEAWGRILIFPLFLFGSGQNYWSPEAVQVRSKNGFFHKKSIKTVF
jgi:hypothetical protein